MAHQSGHVTPPCVMIVIATSIPPRAYGRNRSPVALNVPGLTVARAEDARAGVARGDTCRPNRSACSGEQWESTTKGAHVSGHDPRIENDRVIRAGYDAFARGDLAAVADVFREDAVWHAQALGVLSGDHVGWPAIAGFFGRTMELTNGSFSVAV